MRMVLFGFEGFGLSVHGGGLREDGEDDGVDNSTLNPQSASLKPRPSTQGRGRRYVRMVLWMMVRSGPVKTARSSLNHILNRSCTLSTCTKAGSVLGRSRYEATERREDMTLLPCASLANVEGAVQLREPPVADHPGFSSRWLVPNSRVRSAAWNLSTGWPFPISSVEARGKCALRCCGVGCAVREGGSRADREAEAAPMRKIPCLSACLDSM